MLGKLFKGISKFAAKHSGLLGGLLNLGGAAADYKMDKRALRQAQAQFDQQMDHSVSRRVADAKRAGIHPLFALGGSVGSSPTLTAGGGSPSGSALGDSLNYLLKLNAEASAKRDEAEAGLANAKAAHIRSGLAAAGRDIMNASEVPELFGPAMAGSRYVSDPKYGVSEQVLQRTTLPHPRDSSTAQGVSPAWVLKDFGNGHVGKVFTEESGLEELNTIIAPVHASIAYLKGTGRLYSNAIKEAIWRTKRSPTYKALTKGQKRALEREFEAIRKGARSFPRQGIY